MYNYLDPLIKETHQPELILHLITLLTLMLLVNSRNIPPTYLIDWFVLYFLICLVNWWDQVILHNFCFAVMFHNTMMKKYRMSLVLAGQYNPNISISQTKHQWKSLYFLQCIGQLIHISPCLCFNKGWWVISLSHSQTDQTILKDSHPNIPMVINTMMACFS